MGIRDIINPDRLINTPGGRFPASQVKGMEKEAKKAEKERKKRNKNK